MDEQETQSVQGASVDSQPADTSIPAVETPSATVQAQPAGPENVTLSREDFAALMDRLNGLEKDRDLILQSAPKNQAMKIEELRRQGKLVKSVKLRQIDGKLVVGWRTLQDDVYFESGRLVENQRIELKFSDETSKELSLRQWATITTYVTCDVKSESKTSEGELYLKLQTPDGQELEVNIIYIN